VACLPAVFATMHWAWGLGFLTSPRRLAARPAAPADVSTDVSADVLADASADVPADVPVAPARRGGAAPSSYQRAK
jgi:hypothetical protein